MRIMHSCNVCGNHWPGKTRGPSTCPQCRTTLYNRPYDELAIERRAWGIKMEKAHADFVRMQADHNAAL